MFARHLFIYFSFDLKVISLFYLLFVLESETKGVVLLLSIILNVVDISATERRKKIANNFSYFFRPMGPISWCASDNNL